MFFVDDSTRITLWFVSAPINLMCCKVIEMQRNHDLYVYLKKNHPQILKRVKGVSLGTVSCFIDVNVSKNVEDGSVNRTVSSYFFTLLPSSGNHAWFPDKFFCLQSYMISYLSPNLMANCCEMRAQFARGIVHFSEMLR